MAPAPALDVWLYGTHVAQVFERRTGKFQLEYTAEAFARWPTGRPLLSVALPLVRGRHGPGLTDSFLEGLLPEGEARTVLEARHGVRRGDVRGLLAEIGRDCAGAVVIMPSGEAPPGSSDADPDPLSDEELAAEVRALPDRPLGDGEQVRVSLAGQQPKLLLARLPDGRWTRPVAGRPSTHVVKPGDERYPGMAVNEAFCLRVAREVGLTTVDANLLEVDGADVLVVSRYDRLIGSDGSVTRIHQEDVCQALAVDVGPLGNGKYEQHGGPGWAQVAEILDLHNGAAEETARLAEVVLFTVAIGNADGHGKNLSLLHPPDGRLRLAPLYDQVSTIQYPVVRTPDGERHVSSMLAMRLNALDDIHAVTRADVIAETGRWHHGPPVEARIDALLVRLADALGRAADAIPQAPARLVESIAGRVERLGRGDPADPEQMGRQ